MVKQTIKQKSLAFRLEVVDKMSALATAAFGLVAALAWNSAIQEVFKRYFPAPGGTTSIWPLLGYASFVTLIAVLVIIWIGRIAGRLKNAESDEAAKA